MNFITPLLPAIRVSVFSLVTWSLARAKLPADYAGPTTDWLMAGVAGAVTAAYATWAAKREVK